MSTNRVLTMLREDENYATYHPLKALLNLAEHMDATIPDQIAIHKTIAKYCEAENKQIELISSDGADSIGLRFVIDAPQN